jgi:signal transduction histidine kinase
MQAMQSSTAAFEFESESGHCSGQFAALRDATRANDADVDAARMRRASGTAARVAEGAGLAHDAGNLLGALSLYSDLLARPGVLSEEHREYAAELRMLSDRSWAMIHRLMNHARAERDPRTEVESVVIPDVVGMLRGLLSRVAGRRVQLVYLDGAFQPVAVAAEAVERIVTNLVKNAAEASPAGETIRVSVGSVADGDRRRIVLRVTDEGRGMTAAAVRRLQEDCGPCGERGRGLGLRVVRELVAMSGGCLEIESEPGVGTSVSVEWYGLEWDEVGALMSDEEDFSACEFETHAVERLDATVREIRLVKGAAGWIAC